MSETADEIMLRMGFPATETGEFVTELRAKVAEQVKDGLTHRSGGTFAPGNHSYEEKARAILAMDWAVEHAHAYRVECIDGISSIGDVPVWIGDRFRETAMEMRIVADKLLGRKNPYSKSAPTQVGAA